MRHFYKKTAASFLALTAPACVLAQASEDVLPLAAPFEFLGIKDVKIATTYVYDHGSLAAWNGEGLHAGIVDVSMMLFNHTDIPKGMTAPESAEFSCSVVDATGTVAFERETDLTYTFKRLPFVKNVSKGISVSGTLLRGGKYKAVAGISPDLFALEREFVLPDEASMQVMDNAVSVGAPLSPKLWLTSGYPYVPADFAGENKLRWTVTKAATATEPATDVAEHDEVFELQSETADLAAFATLNLKIEDPAPGVYVYTVSSPDFAPANYTFKGFVNDVFVPVVTIDKESYKVGESTEAVVTAEMDFDYPYVGAAAEGEPTVTVVAKLLEQETKAEYRDAAWASAPMHCVGRVKVPLDKVTAEVVKEHNGEVLLTLSFLFNGVLRCELPITLHFEDGASAPVIVADPTIRAVRYFNVMGMEIDPSTYRGLIITSDGRKLLR